MPTHAAGASPSPVVTFWGAARAVTGSMHLVEAAGRKVLLDCGAFRSLRPATHPHLHAFPFPPPTIDAVVLSHAHVDHCGHLPALIGQGFAGPIFCTAATRDLITLMLADSARIQEEEAFVQAVVSGPEAAAPPVASHREHVRQTVGRCVTLGYDEEREILPGIAVRLVDPGHILGSAMVALRVAGAGRNWRITFTGDLGRHGSPLLREPAPVPPGDLVISESTYGNRVLDSPAAAALALEAVVGRTIERGGKVLIPAFGLGRTQLVVQCLWHSLRAGRLPRLPVYVDSPLATDIAEVYHRHPEGLKEPFTAGPADGGDSLIQYVRSSDDSAALAARREPCVIVAPGGMCDGGRILRHLRENIDDPRGTVVMVSYQAPHSLGRRLLEPRPTIRFHGRKWNRWIDFVQLPGFSGHPDRNELLDFLSPLAGPATRLRLVHGEPEPMEALARALRAGFVDVGLPALGETVTVG